MTVINPLQTHLVGQAATKAGAALEAAYTRKMMVSVPMPWETLGVWHEQMVEQIKKLASAQARQTGEDRSNTIRLLNRQPSHQAQTLTG